MRNVARKLTAVSLAVLVGFSFGGCQHMSNYGQVVKRDAGNFWATTERAFLGKWPHGFKSVWQTFDRHVMNYDWDDPRLD